MNMFLGIIGSPWGKKEQLCSSEASTEDPPADTFWWIEGWSSAPLVVVDGSSRTAHVHIYKYSGQAEYAGMWH